MTRTAAYKFDNGSFLTTFAVDSVREAIEAERFPGLRADDPMLAAMLSVIERFDQPISSRALAEALPHVPEEFTVFDVQSTLSRLGVGSRIEYVRRRSLSKTTCPAILIEPTGSVRVLYKDTDGALLVLDPVSRQIIPNVPAQNAQIVTFHKPKPQNSKWFVFDLFYRCRKSIFAVLGVKLVTNLITVLIALSIFALFDSVVSYGATDTLLAIGFGMAVAFGVDFLFRMAKAKLLAKISSRLEYLVSSLTFRQVTSLGLEKLVAGTVAQQIARLRPLHAMASSVVVPLLDAISDVPFALLLTIVLFFLAGPIAFLPLAVLVVFAVSFALMMPGIRRREDLARQSAETHSQVMADLVEHADTIRMSYNRRHWAERAKHAVRLRASSQRKAEVAARKLAMVGSLATPLVGGTTAVAGAALAMSGNLSTGGLIAAMILSSRIIAPMQTLLLLASKWSDLLRLSGQLNRLMAMLGEQVQKDLPAQPALTGDIDFSGVAYRFGNAPDLALRNVSASIPAGSFVAVTGPSGAGKTTLLRLMSALLQPLAGTVQIDGLNLRQLPVDLLRARVSYVPFDPVLIHGTIAQNIRLSSPLAGDDEVLSVLREIGLSDVVSALPQGMHTRLTDDVINTLPKGFRQALAIVQALVTKPCVLLLDEPARSLDPHLEETMMRALMSRRGRMTTLMVTHRPSHIQAADFELSLQAGTVSRFAPLQLEAS